MKCLHKCGYHRDDYIMYGGEEIQIEICHRGDIETVGWGKKH